MDRVAQRLSAARLARRRDYEREVASRAARPQPPCAHTEYRLAAGREVVRATDGRDYAVLPPPANPAPVSLRKCEHDQRTPTVVLDPAKDCVIDRSSHVDPCAHRPRILLEINRSDVLKATQITLPRRKTPLNLSQSTLTSQNKNNKTGIEVPKKYCKGSAFSPLTDWCSSWPKIEPDRPGCRQPSLVERIKRRSDSSSKEVRKFHTAPSFLLKSVPATVHNGSSENEYRDVIAKVKADAQKLSTMLNDRAKLKEAGRGRIMIPEETEVASASGQLELRAPAGGAGVRVHVSLFGEEPAVRPTALPSDTAPHDPSSMYYDKCNSWLSIKNIQKKLTGCRKDSTNTKHLGDDESSLQNLSKEIKWSPGASPFSPKTLPKRSSYERKEQSPDYHCQTKQKPKGPP